MTELATLSAKSLKACTSEVVITEISNMTSESIDKNILLSKISDAFKSAQMNVDSKSEVIGKLKISSSSSETKTSYQVIYTWNAILTKQNKNLFKSAVQLTKSSQIGL